MLNKFFFFFFCTAAQVHAGDGIADGGADAGVQSVALPTRALCCSAVGIRLVEHVPAGQSAALPEHCSAGPVRQARR